MSQKIFCIVCRIVTLTLKIPGGLNSLTPPSPPLNTALKVGAISNLPAKQAEKIGAVYAELSHCRAFLNNLPPKNILPVFNFLLPPTFSRRHLPPPVNGVNAPVCEIAEISL